MLKHRVEYLRVRRDEDAAAAAALVWEFFDYLRDHFPDHAEALESYIGGRGIAGEIASLTTHFNPPDGECILAKLDGEPVGTLMLRRIDEDLAELNRMYVRPSARGHGIGRGLCERLIEAAHELGFHELRLEALDEGIEALPLYRKLGFTTDPDPTDFAREHETVVSLRRAV